MVETKLKVLGGGALLLHRNARYLPEVWCGCSFVRSMKESILYLYLCVWIERSVGKLKGARDYVVGP